MYVSKCLDEVDGTRKKRYDFCDENNAIQKKNRKQWLRLTGWLTVSGQESCYTAFCQKLPTICHPLSESSCSLKCSFVFDPVIEKAGFESFSSCVFSAAKPLGEKRQRNQPSLVLRSENVLNCCTPRLESLKSFSWTPCLWFRPRSRCFCPQSLWPHRDPQLPAVKRALAWGLHRFVDPCPGVPVLQSILLSKQRRTETTLLL